MTARKNIMEKAAHGSSGVNELKTCAAGLLTRAKKTKNQIRSAARRITKYVIFSIFVFFGPLLFSEQYRLIKITGFTWTSQTATQKDSRSMLSTLVPYDDKAAFFRAVDDLLYDYLFNRTNAASFVISPASVATPSVYELNSTIDTINSPVGISTNGGNSVSFYPSFINFPRSYSLFQISAAYFSVNPDSSCFQKTRRFNDNRYNVNFSPGSVFAEISLSTNSVIVSAFLNRFSEINSQLSNIAELVDVNAYTLSDILDNLSGFVGPLRSKPFTEQIEAFSKNQGIYNAYITPEQLQLYKDEYNSLADRDPLAAAHYADSILGSLNSAQSLLNLQRAMSDVWPSTTDALGSLGQYLNEHLEQAVNNGFSMSAHIEGATTNLLQKMTNMTDQIKNDLEAWRTDATNRLAKQWEGLKSVETNTQETASGVAGIVKDGVKINGPVEVTIGTDNINVDIANTDLNSLIDGFADGSDAAMQRWLDEWESFKAGQLPYMDRFSSFISSNTNLLSSIEERLDFGFTNTLDATYAFMTNGLESAISNGVAGIGLNLTNELWDYYFDRFQKANEFRDDEGQLFSYIDWQRQLVFGNGFDDAEYRKLDWFSRVELLLYQIGYASTNSTESIEASDLEGEFDDVSDEIQTAASAFEGAASRVVGVFSLVGGFAQAIRNAFSDVAAPSTDGILLLEGGSWIVDEPLYLRVPVLIQNALRLVFQCTWYLSAFVIGWRLVSFAWGRVASLVRWLWSLIDV